MRTIFFWIIFATGVVFWAVVILAALSFTWNRFGIWGSEYALRKRLSKKSKPYEYSE